MSVSCYECEYRGDSWEGHSCCQYPNNNIRMYWLFDEQNFCNYVHWEYAQRHMQSEKDGSIGHVILIRSG